eukprot:c11562_g1_i3.p1 GENE.c11562_g1_i3~~c11562_g1_i3.p1  ORF type:complete len:1783 (+),score=538.87 c11562_g1_i3:38-5350(+)
MSGGGGGWEPVNRWATALYNFDGTGKYEIPLMQGDRIQVLDKEPRGWMQGINMSTGKKGNFPASYVELQEPLPPPDLPPRPSKFVAPIPRLIRQDSDHSSSSGDTSGATVPAPTSAVTEEAFLPARLDSLAALSTSRNSLNLDVSTPRIRTQGSKVVVTDSENLQKEIDQCMKEWVEELKKSLQAQKLREYNMVKDRMAQLVDWRNQLHDTTLPESVRAEWRKKIIRLMEGGRRLMGLDMIPRTVAGEPADETNTSLVKLVELYHETHQRDLDIVNELSDSAVPAMRRQSMVEDRVTQLMLDVKLIMVSPHEPTAYHFSLYHKQESGELRQLTDNYIAYRNAQSIPCASLYEHEPMVDLVTNSKVIFSNVPLKLYPSLYLVLRLFRYGKLLPNEPRKDEGRRDSSVDGKRETENSFRRPFGMSVLHVGGIMPFLENEAECERIVPVLVFKEEEQFATMHELIAQGKSFEKAPLAKGVALALRMFFSDTDELCHERGELRGIPMAPTLELEEMRPGFTRHDMFVVIRRGEFLQGAKKSAKNVMITVKLLTRQGHPVTDSNAGCMVVGTTNVQRKYITLDTWVQYHSNDPVFNDMFVLRIPRDKMVDVHLRLEAAHISSSKKPEPFSFFFLPLMDSRGVVLMDGDHTLDAYKFPTKAEAGCPYLPDIATPVGTNSCHPSYGINRKKETLIVQTILCSTLTTQYPLLNDVIRWRENRERFGEVFSKFGYVDAPELLKFLPEILDAMFGITFEIKTASLNQNIFDALVTLLSKVGDDTKKSVKGSQFRPLLAHYIETRVSNTSARGFQEFAEVHTMLVMCLNNTLARPESKEMRDAMKCLRYLIQLMSASRTAYNQNRNLSVEENHRFKQDTTKVLGSINKVMGDTNQVWRGAQDITIKNFGKVFEDLSSMYSSDELGLIAQQFLEAIKADAPSTRKLVLVLIKSLIDGHDQGDEVKRSDHAGTLFMDKALRDTLIPTIMQRVLSELSAEPSDKLTTTDCVSLKASCIDIILAMLNSFEDLALLKEHDQVDQDVKQPHTHPAWAMLETSPLSSNLLVKLFHFLETARDEEPARSATKAATAMVTLLHLVFPTNLPGPESAALLQSKILNKLPTEQEDMVELLFRISKSLMVSARFKESWVVMHMTTMRTSLMAMAAICHLQTTFSQSERMANLRTEMLVHLFATTNAKELRLATFSQFKQQFVLSRYGDMRERVCELLMLLWRPMPDDVKNKLIPSLIEQTLALSQSDCDKARQTAQEVFANMLAVEYRATKSFTVAEQHTVNNATAMMEADGGQTLKLLLQSANDYLHTSTQEVATAVSTFIRGITDLVDHMSELQMLGHSSDFEIERSQAALRLISYLREAHSHRQHLRFQTTMLLARDIHEQLGNNIEGGLVLKKYADGLEWSSEVMPAYSSGGRSYNEQSMRDRKEQILMNAIDLFSSGKDWERAVAVSRELQQLYEREYDYERLSRMLQNQADMYKRILNTDRFFPEYFRVEFRGAGFEERNGQIYVYRGSVQEDLRSFMDRMQRRYPKAVLKLRDEPHDPTIDLIYIVTVRPARDPHLKVEPETVQVPEKILKYRLADNVNVFTHSIQQRESKEKTDNEFKDMWTIKYFYTTEDIFPHPVRSSRVVKHDTVRLTPVESAVENLRSSYAHLARCIAENAPKADRCGDTADLSRYLGGIIDAAVNGGPRKYFDAFIVPEYAQANPDRKESIAELRKMLMNLSQLIPQGLDVHQRICSHEMVKLHNHLQETFDKDWIGKIIQPIREMEGRS